MCLLPLQLPLPLLPAAALLDWGGEEVRWNVVACRTLYR